MNIGFHFRCASHYHIKFFILPSLLDFSEKGEQPPAQLPQPSSATSNALAPPQLPQPHLTSQRPQYHTAALGNSSCVIQDNCGSCNPVTCDVSQMMEFQYQRVR